MFAIQEEWPDPLELFAEFARKVGLSDGERQAFEMLINQRRQPGFSVEKSRKVQGRAMWEGLVANKRVYAEIRGLLKDGGLWEFLLDDVALNEGRVCATRREAGSGKGLVALDKLYDDRFRVWEWLGDVRELARMGIVLAELRDGGTGERRQGMMGSRML